MTTTSHPCVMRCVYLDEAHLQRTRCNYTGPRQQRT
uniref:Uncharacterized protein n=1 Tax=Anguilla anguilla TaxID=7936 RepID=A0A0E9W3S2_ANGAN